MTCGSIQTLTMLYRYTLYIPLIATKRYIFQRDVCLHHTDNFCKKRYINILI